MRILVFLVVGCFPATVPGYVDPVYSPKVLRDEHGNEADEHNDVTWATFSKGFNYTMPEDNSKLDLDIYFDMVNAFLYVLQPDDPPYGAYIYKVLPKF